MCWESLVQWVPVMQDKSNTLSRVCDACETGQEVEAAAILAAEYRFSPTDSPSRKYTELDRMKVFVRDRFTDRYSGRRLVFPGTLRLLSRLLPDAFPYHRNWKTDKCHFAFWELYPTIDHVEPVTRGGKDCEHNFVSTSQLLNGAKGNFTLQELGWKLHPVNEDDRWDGLTGWFLRQTLPPDDELSPGLKRYLQRWRAAAIATSSHPRQDRPTHSRLGEGE
jgi:hypothetical protein